MQRIVGGHAEIAAGHFCCSLTPALCGFDHDVSEFTAGHAYVPKAVAGNARRRLGMQRILGTRFKVWWSSLTSFANDHFLPLPFRAQCAPCRHYSITVVTLLGQEGSLNATSALTDGS
jgi:hypothetical protein